VISRTLQFRDRCRKDHGCLREIKQTFQCDDDLSWTRVYLCLPIIRKRYDSVRLRRYE